MNSRRLIRSPRRRWPASPSGKVRPSDLAVLTLIAARTWLTHHRQLGRSRAAENSAGIDAGLAIGVRQVGGIAHQAAGSHEFALAVDRRQCIACCECDDLVAPDGEERARTDHHRTGAKLLRRLEGGVDLAFGALRAGYGFAGRRRAPRPAHRSIGSRTSARSNGAGRRSGSRPERVRAAAPTASRRARRPAKRSR